MKRSVLMILAAASAACSSSTAPEPVTLQNQLQFERENGSMIDFASTTYIWCGAWEEGEVAVPSVHVIVGSAERNWRLSAVRADVVPGQPLSFPNTFIWNEPRRADLFVFDSPNELSTQTTGSSGQMTFHELDCRTGGAVRFTIDATVGSEFGDGPPIVVQGSFRGPAGAPPTP